MKTLPPWLKTTAKILFRILRAFVTLIFLIWLYSWYEDKSFIDKCMERHQDMEYEEAIQYCEETLAEMREID